MAGIESIRIGRFEVKLRNTGERFEFAVLDKDGRLVRRENADSRDAALEQARALISDVQVQQNLNAKTACRLQRSL